MTIYVLHLDPPLGHARHYIGYTADDDPSRRIGEHLCGGAKASPLIRAALAQGSSVRVAHVITGPGADRTFERRLKNRGSAVKWCPLCGVASRPLPSCEAA